MNHILSNAELRSITAASRVLLSPHAYPTIDAWRHAVPPAITALQILRDRNGEEFDARALALLELLVPSFRAGVDAVRRGNPLGSAWRLMNELGQAVVAFDADGAIVHRTHAFELLIAREADAGLLTDGVRTFADEVRGHLCAGALANVERTVRTSSMRYDVRVTMARDSETFDGLLLAAVTPHGRPSRTDDELRTRHGLTATEVRVARLIAEGCSSPRIGERLDISVHTARRHTEGVFRKLGVATRSAVAARLAD